MGSGERVFIDTNVVVYANDRREPKRQRIAIDKIGELMRRGTGVISTQVLMEYGAVANRKLGQSQEAIARQTVLLEKLDVVTVTGTLIRNGLELVEAEGVSFWDGVILAAALAANCDTLLSEDFGDGRRYAGMIVRNPFVSI
jgi:predicted nucleic acid-binding protein